MKKYDVIYGRSCNLCQHKILTFVFADTVASQINKHKYLSSLQRKTLNYNTSRTIKIKHLKIKYKTNKTNLKVKFGNR